MSGIDPTSVDWRAFHPPPTPAELRRLADVIESQHCTGVTATWCPVHGDCACPPDPDIRYLNADGCPLHDSASSHAEAERQAP